MSGERGRNRTFNPLIKSQLLCQLSYAPGNPKILHGVRSFVELALQLTQNCNGELVAAQITERERR